VASVDVRVNGILVTVDSHTGKAEHIERFVIYEESPSDHQAYDSDDGKPDYTNGF
jgi:calcineurin-like phosphoesterase